MSGRKRHLVPEFQIEIVVGVIVAEVFPQGFEQRVHFGDVFFCRPLGRERGHARLDGNARLDQRLNCGIGKLQKEGNRRGKVFPIGMGDEMATIGAGSDFEHALELKIAQGLAQGSARHPVTLERVGL